MARNKRGRAFELDGVRYLGSPPPQAAFRVKYVDMREIGSGPPQSAEAQLGQAKAIGALRGDELRSVQEIGTAVGESKGRRAALPIFDPSPSVVASEPEGEGVQE